MLAPRAHGRNRAPAVGPWVIALHCVEWGCAVGAPHGVEVASQHGHCHAQPLGAHWRHLGPPVCLGVVPFDKVEARNSVLATHCVQVAVKHGHSHARATRTCWGHVA
uniref:Putative secreted protein n=1 Tax=Ixodes ricinus TaxID=34613 RepID=A0A6B0UI34_IXORI